MFKPDVEIVEAMDAAIKQWSAVALHKQYCTDSCPLCTLNNAREGEENDLDVASCGYCPITAFTEETGCYGTVFYYTDKMGQFQNTPKTKANNTMLLQLYEVRRAYITGELALPVMAWEVEDDDE